MNLERHKAMDGSVTQWLLALRSDNQEAARQLWERYFQSLCTLARRKLGTAPRRTADEEDVAQSALADLCQGLRQGKFLRLHDRSDLWRLLLKMTHRKAVDQIRRGTRQKRGGGGVRGESAFGHLDRGGIDGVAAATPPPELAAMLEEEYNALLERLGDDSLRRTAGWRLQGCSNAEIAERLEISTRAVERKLQLIRRIWKAELDHD